MGFKDNLVKNKKGSFVLKSKTTKKSKTFCLECGDDAVTRDLLYEYKAADLLAVRTHMEDHLISYPKHKSIKPEWCTSCKALQGYKVTLDNEKSN